MIAFVRDAYFIMRNLNRICLHLWEKQRKKKDKFTKINQWAKTNKTQSVVNCIHTMATNIK